MNHTRALQLLTQHKAQLSERFGVTRLALFGSTVRDVRAGIAMWMCS